MGSKRRIAKEILPIILKDRKEGQWYVEPFCGGCNTIDKVPQGAGRLANDIHTPLISMFKALQVGWTPPKEVSEEEYKAAKLLEDSNPLKGYIGFNLSFGAKYFGGYARHNDGGKRSSSKEAFSNVTKQIPDIVDIRFANYSYQELPIPDTSIIYCDPPYLNSTGYKDKLNHEEFYEWCRARRAEGHTIFISEYTMPEDFIELWAKVQVTNLTNLTKANYNVEKLFTLP